MKTIWKFNVPIRDLALIEMPKGAQTLSVGVQGQEICMWAIVDPNAEKEMRRFSVHGTGIPMEFGLPGKFIGTVQIVTIAGVYVGHVFEAGLV